MRYADKFCTYQEVYEPEHVYIFTGPCIMTGKEVSVSVKAEELYAYRTGSLIQQALRSNNSDEREFLISGISSEAFDKAFGEDDE